MMQVIPGGAAARPFVTHHNALDMRHVPAHRAGAVPEAPGGRRLRAGLRDQPQFPQRGAVDPAQPRVHDARALPGLRRLPRPDGPDRADVPGHRRHGAAARARSSTRARRSTSARPSAASRSRTSSCTSIRESTARACATSTTCAACAPGSASRSRPADGAGKLQIEIFEKTGEHRLLQPTFVYAYPAEVSPLARRNDADPVPHRPLRVLHRRARDRQRLLRAQRRRGPGGALPRAGRAQERRRRGGDVLRRRLRPRARVRHAADGRPRHRHRPPGDAVHRTQPSIRDVLLFPHMRPE